MSPGVLEFRGELFVTLESAARCYQVELTWVEEVFATGLLGPGERLQGSLAMRVAELDRLATILRWNRHHGLDLETVTALLGA